MTDYVDTITAAHGKWMTRKGSKKVTMIESMVRRFDAEVREKKVEDAPKAKRTTRTDWRREEEHTGKERLKSILIRGYTRVLKYMQSTIGVL
jgi:hypothetical protein